MSTINISDLRPTGSELFSDSESYMGELSEHELSVQGGGSPLTLIGAAARASTPKCVEGAKVAGVAAVSLAVAAGGYVKGRFF